MATFETRYELTQKGQDHANALEDHLLLKDPEDFNLLPVYTVFAGLADGYPLSAISELIRRFYKQPLKTSVSYTLQVIDEGIRSGYIIDSGSNFSAEEMDLGKDPKAWLRSKGDPYGLETKVPSKDPFMGDFEDHF